MANAIFMQGVTYSYPSSPILSFPDMDCRQGEHYLMSGVSGCGKTTLLYLLAGLIKPDTGKILIQGEDITSMGNKDIDRIRGRKIGLVFQKPQFIQSLSVLENLQIARYLNDIPAEKDELLALLERLNIGDKQKSRPWELSQGEQQRLSIARAIINRPALILADEPTSSLDDENCREAVSLLKSQAESTGACLLVVTHDHRLHPFFSHIIKL
ncbi:ABC transporter ATP-binding protein [Parabacteroides sp. Marseille-P3160]|uniref:ABC transporter ATP-binding protein n=1 Tax=Parabacteroides sp. Marseille-P3160 TaxID=1917887 RepID=UPI0009BBF161|nr:ATP-binding cassette domain-containing protein [Parabacteroides sp. Marseille-P3160]